MVRAVMHRSGPLFRSGRPGSGLRVARLAGSALATLGLLGHGLAMLLVAVLADTPAGDAAAGGLPALVEICAADGQTRFVPTGSEQAPARPQAPGQAPGHDQGHLKLCPVCTAFAQAGLADLPAPLVQATQDFHAAPWQPAADTPAAGHSGLSALSRGPPAAA